MTATQSFAKAVNSYHTHNISLTFPENKESWFPDKRVEGGRIVVSLLKLFRGENCSFLK